MDYRLAIPVVMLAAAGSSLPAAAANALPPAVSRLIDCRALADKEARLACYDTQVAALAEATAKTDIVILDRESTQKTRRSLFGLNIGALPIFGGGNKDEQANQLTDIEATLGSARALDQGKWAFVLEDGAQWVSTEPVIGRDPKAGETIAIRRAAMGSFIGKIGSGRAFRVRRIN